MTEPAILGHARLGRFRLGIHILDTLDKAVAGYARAEGSRADVVKPELPKIVEKVKMELVGL